MAGPISTSTVLGGMPSGVPSGSDQLLGSVPAGGRQPPVKLITAAGEMDGHRANPFWSRVLGPLPGRGGSRPQETQAHPSTPCVSRVSQPPLLYNGSSTVTV